MDNHRISVLLLAIAPFMLQGCGGADSLNVDDVKRPPLVTEVTEFAEANEPGGRDTLPVGDQESSEDEPVTEPTDADRTDEGSYDLVPVFRFIEPESVPDATELTPGVLQADEPHIEDELVTPSDYTDHDDHADAGDSDRLDIVDVDAEVEVEVDADTGVEIEEQSDAIADKVASEESVQSDGDDLNSKDGIAIETDGASTDDAADAVIVDNTGNVEATEAADLEPQSDTEQGTGLAAITDLLFLTGQSNAASLETEYDAELDAPDSRVFAYTDNGWRVADLHQFWDEGIPGNWAAEIDERDPYNNIIFQVGKSLARDANRTVGIVMLTAPGEGISHWDYDGKFYQRMRDHAIASLNELPHKSAFDAVIWMQGETDWLWEGTADPDVQIDSYVADSWLNYYPRKLNELINTLRSDAWFGNQARFICTETIKAALNPHLMALNNDGDERTGCALASDLEARDSDPHRNHFSGAALRVLGKRISDVYMDLLPR